MVSVKEKAWYVTGYKELGMNGIVVARLLDVIQSYVSRAVKRGEKSALDNQYDLILRCRMYMKLY